jgi:membrane protease YdiL (CAAX protease family)
LSGLRQISWRSGWVRLGCFCLLCSKQVASRLIPPWIGQEIFTLTAGAAVLLFSSNPFIFFFGGALNEEPAWRALGTPRLLRRFSPLAVGLIMGVVWSMRHFPLHVTIFDENDFIGFAFHFVYKVPLGVLFTWLYYRSGGNLFACMLLHASYNSAGNLLGGCKLACVHPSDDSVHGGRRRAEQDVQSGANGDFGGEKWLAPTWGAACSKLLPQQQRLR